jgi:dolichol-phosphate mannosyltransferase
MKPLVIVPTYNERENIVPLVTEVLGLYPNVNILVVDDNSPDGTGAAVIELQKKFNRVHLLSRPGKQGLGKAYLAGFKWGLEKDFDRFIEMDADFSHRPVDLGKIIEASKNSDFVVGSRYVPGGQVVNWGIGRQFISRGGSFYARTILGYPMKDWTGGFNLWSRKVLESLELDSIRSEGYSFQIELKYRSLKRGFNQTEVPIVFEDRRVGQSKMSSRIFFEALLRVWQIRFYC